MKYAEINDEGQIVSIHDTAKMSYGGVDYDWPVSDGGSVEAISNAKAGEIAKAMQDEEIPAVMDGEEVVEEAYTRKAEKHMFLIDGEIKTPKEVSEARQSAKRAEMDARFTEAEANRVPVLGAVKKYTFHKRLKALGKWEAFNSEIKKAAEIKDLYDNSHELDINDPDVIALSPLIKTAVGVTDAEYDSLFEV